MNESWVILSWGTFKWRVFLVWVASGIRFAIPCPFGWNLLHVWSKFGFAFGTGLPLTLDFDSVYGFVWHLVCGSCRVGVDFKSRTEFGSKLASTPPGACKNQSRVGFYHKIGFSNFVWNKWMFRLGSFWGWAQFWFSCPWCCFRFDFGFPTNFGWENAWRPMWNKKAIIVSSDWALLFNAWLRIRLAFGSILLETSFAFEQTQTNTFVWKLDWNVVSLSNVSVEVQRSFHFGVNWFGTYIWICFGFWLRPDCNKVAILFIFKFGIRVKSRLKFVLACNIQCEFLLSWYSVQFGIWYENCFEILFDVWFSWNSFWIWMFSAWCWVWCGIRLQLYVWVHYDLSLDQLQILFVSELEFCFRLASYQLEFALRLFWHCCNFSLEFRWGLDWDCF